MKAPVPQVVTEKSQSRWGIFGYLSASASQHFPTQPLVLPHCNPVNPAGKFVCVPAWRRGQHLQEWSGNGGISNVPPKIAAIPQPRAWRSCVDKSRREQQHMVKCLMPSGIFPGMFEDLRLKCCSQGLPQSLYLTRLDLLAARLGWAAPNTSPLSQKKISLKGWKRILLQRQELVRRKESSNVVSFLQWISHPRQCTSAPPALPDTHKLFLGQSNLFFSPWSLSPAAGVPRGRAQPWLLTSAAAGRAPSSSREHPRGSQPHPSPAGELLHPPILPGRFRVCGQQAPGCEGLLDCSGLEHHLLSCWLGSIAVLGQTQRSRFLCCPRSRNATNTGWHHAFQP